MEYTIKKLCGISGVTARTLRYYDQIGLLKPNRISSNGYRIYGKDEVDKLQQILFYRELGYSLEDINTIIMTKNFNIDESLSKQLKMLTEKREQLDLLIDNVKKSIKARGGDFYMSDKEKFDGFKQKLLDENEKKYGNEIREKYGEENIKASNKKFMNMTKEQYEAVQELSLRFNETLKAAVETGDPASETAQKACQLHKEWLCHFWASYSVEAHLGVTQMYVDDERFTEYYEKIVTGGAVFLRDAVKIFCGK